MFEALYAYKYLLASNILVVFLNKASFCVSKSPAVLDKEPSKNYIVF